MKVFAERFVFVFFEPEKFKKVQVKNIAEVDTTGGLYISLRMCVERTSCPHAHFGSVLILDDVGIISVCLHCTGFLRA